MTTETFTGSAGSAAASSAPGHTRAPTFSRLLGAEFRRLLARRFTRILVGLALIGYLVAIGVLWTQHHRATPADLAQATAQRDRQFTEYRQSVQQCLSDAGGSADKCGPLPEKDMFPPDQYLQYQPFQPRLVGGYTVAVGVAVALAAFLLGATFIGAEWSSKNLIAWLFYEPRRLRMMGAKLLALAGLVAVLALVAQLIWTLTAHLLISQRGVAVGPESAGPDFAHFWSDIALTQLRAGALALPALLLGFGLASLIRNTAAALGVAFVYIAVVESVLRGFTPGTQPYLFTVNVQAWINRGGTTVYGDPVFDPAQNLVLPQPTHLSNTHGGIALLLYAGIVLGAALLTFRRRDIT